MKPNLLFLVVDSLRQDKCIGEQKSSVTPNLDKFIKNGTFFNQTVSTASITVPSLSSIFTGLYPFECTILDLKMVSKTNEKHYVRGLLNHILNAPQSPIKAH